MDKMSRFHQISSKSQKKSAKITNVPHFDVKLGLFKNFGGMKTIWNRENTSREKEYQKRRKIVGGVKAALKSA